MFQQDQLSGLLEPSFNILSRKFCHLHLRYIFHCFLQTGRRHLHSIGILARTLNPQLWVDIKSSVVGEHFCGNKLSLIQSSFSYPTTVQHPQDSFPNMFWFILGTVVRSCGVFYHSKSCCDMILVNSTDRKGRWGHIWRMISINLGVICLCMVSTQQDRGSKFRARGSMPLLPAYRVQGTLGFKVLKCIFYMSPSQVSRSQSSFTRVLILL